MIGAFVVGAIVLQLAVLVYCSRSDKQIDREKAKMDEEYDNFMTGPLPVRPDEDTTFLFDDD